MFRQSKQFLRFTRLPQETLIYVEICYDLYDLDNDLNRAANRNGENVSFGKDVNFWRRTLRRMTKRVVTNFSFSKKKKDKKHVFDIKALYDEVTRTKT